MGRLVMFEQVTLDGYFAGPNGDLSWAHRDNQDAEWNAFVAGNASAGGMLVFGRITYELMASYWPTPQAHANDPVVAERMNSLPKVVFSRTLQQPTWSNTTLVKGAMIEEMRKMKKESAKDMAILGSGSVVAQLAHGGLIDEYQIVVNPIVLGNGKRLFDGINSQVLFKLTSTRTFGNGNVLLCYAPRA